MAALGRCWGQSQRKGKGWTMAVLGDHPAHVSIEQQAFDPRRRHLAAIKPIRVCRAHVSRAAIRAGGQMTVLFCERGVIDTFTCRLFLGWEGCRSVRSFLNTLQTVQPRFHLPAAGSLALSPCLFLFLSLPVCLLITLFLSCGCGFYTRASWATGSR